MRQLLLSLFVATIAVSCGPRYVDYFPRHDDGSSKPAVALLPVRDSTQSCLPKPAGEHIFQVLQYESMSKGNLYILAPEELREGNPKIKEIGFYSDETTLAQDFCSADFVVILELFEQEFSSYGKARPPINNCVVAYPCEALLTLKMRVKIVDVRPRSPRVVLQEVYTQGYYLPYPLEKDSEPLVKAYHRFACSLENRLEEVICSAY